MKLQVWCVHLSRTRRRLVQNCALTDSELWYWVCGSQGHFPRSFCGSGHPNREYGYKTGYVACCRFLCGPQFLIGESKPFIRNVFTLKTCSHIVGSQVICFENEEDLLQKWRDFVAEVDPDVVIGYNISNFDFPYLIDRAKALKVSTFPYLGRMRGEYLTSRRTLITDFKL